jgi:hypothetical protein
MKRICSAIFVLALLLCCLPTGASGAEIKTTESGIQYSVKRGTVTIEGYSGSSTVMSIPSKIDGLPVTAISAQTCRGDMLITEVRIPKSVATVGEYAFAECPNLTKVVINGAQFIGRSAFRDCKALLTLKLPSNLNTIDDFAFEGCTMLGKVEIPKGLKSIGTDAFMGCERVRFDADSNKYALEYAKSNNIPTGFDPWTVRVIVIGVTSALLFGAVLLVDKAVKRAKKTKA